MDLTSHWEWLRLNSLCRWRDTSFTFWRHGSIVCKYINTGNPIKIAHSDGTRPHFHHNLMLPLTLISPPTDHQSLKLWAGSGIPCSQPAPAVYFTHNSIAGSRALLPVRSKRQKRSSGRNRRNSNCD